MMLFEDTISNSPYELLKFIYGDKIHGSGGNCGLVNSIRNIMEPTIVYIDVMPDKIETIEAYYSLLDAINDKTNFSVIPIPCIEYYTIKAFMNKELDCVNCAITFGDYRKVSYIDRKRKYLATSNFESYCKSIVLNYDSCFKNHGEFYSENCLCNTGKYKCSVPMTVIQKSMMFIACLPVYEIKESITLKHEKVTSFNINEKCVNLYNEIARKYYGFGITKELNVLLSMKEYYEV